MKGVVFCEFIHFIEEKYGFEFCEKVISQCNLNSGCAYTAVGQYDYKELLSLIEAAQEESSKTGQQENKPDNILFLFGIHIINFFKNNHPDFFLVDLFKFIESVNDHIHTEVLKIYPDAELPTITCQRVSDKKLSVSYRSTRPLADFAEALLHGSIQVYDENCELAREPQGSCHQCTFILTRN